MFDELKLCDSYFNTVHMEHDDKAMVNPWSSIQQAYSKWHGSQAPISTMLLNPMAIATSLLSTIALSLHSLWTKEAAWFLAAEATMEYLEGLVNPSFYFTRDEAVEALFLVVKSLNTFVVNCL